MKVAAFVLLFGCIARAQVPVEANLCDMVERPDRFKDKLVSVRAEAVVGFEIQALVDGSCPKQRIWFELDEPRRDAQFRTIERAWKRNPHNIGKKITATLIGYYDTGSCFGHQCFSRTQLRVRQFRNVTSTNRRLAPDFSPYDCSLLIGDAPVRFQKGHIDNVRKESIFVKALEMTLASPTGGPLTYGAIVQVALTRTRLKVIEPKAGVFRLSSLAPGAYVFSAVAEGFQSVTGCVVITPNARKLERLRIELPFGV